MSLMHMLASSYAQCAPACHALGPLSANIIVLLTAVQPTISVHFLMIFIVKRTLLQHDLCYFIAHTLRRWRPHRAANNRAENSFTGHCPHQLCPLTGCACGSRLRTSHRSLLQKT